MERVENGATPVQTWIFDPSLSERRERDLLILTKDYENNPQRERERDRQTDRQIGKLGNNISMVGFTTSVAFCWFLDIHGDHPIRQDRFPEIGETIRWLCHPIPVRALTECWKKEHHDQTFKGRLHLRDSPLLFPFGFSSDRSNVVPSSPRSYHMIFLFKGQIWQLSVIFWILHWAHI